MTSNVSADQRRQMIAEAAYFRAARRGFSAGDSVADWLEAEAEINERLRKIEAARLLESLAAGVESATRKLASMKRKASTLAAGGRAEVHRDIDRLGQLRDSLRVKLKDLRAQGERAGDAAVQQAEGIWHDLTDAIRRLGPPASH